jgi:uncharacterized membrane protein YfcA
MTNGKVPSERLFKHHQRQWQLYLLFCVVMAIGSVIAVLLPGENPEVVLVPTVLVLAVMLALHLIVRGATRRSTGRSSAESTRMSGSSPVGIVSSGSL